jgi:hypothetical protein
MHWYTWVFDGLRSTALAGVCAVTYRKFFGKKPTVHLVPVTDNPRERQSSEPTPSQISDQIQAALPFDRIHAGEKYKGLSVVWKVIFSGVDHRTDLRVENDVTIEFQYWSFYCAFYGPQKTYLHTGVSFSFLSVPPELKLIREGDTIWVQGKIKWVSDTGTVRLEDDPLILETIYKERAGSH